MRRFFSLLLVVIVCSAHGAESLPPAPTRYFNDYTGTVRPDTAAALNKKLEQFEKDTSSQIVVAMFGRMPDVDFEDYANRLFRSWKIGQASKNNGILLLVFKNDRKLRVEVGYGLEGVLPDAIANQIIAREIVPHLKKGDFDSGLTAGVNAILLGARCEKKGTGRTVASRRDRRVQNPSPVVFFLILLAFIFAVTMFGFGRRGTQYHRRRRNYWGPILTSGWGGGSWVGGGRSGGGGGFSGGFSGGGGSSGGGGASGSW